MAMPFQVAVHGRKKARYARSWSSRRVWPDLSGMADQVMARCELASSMVRRCRVDMRHNSAGNGGESLLLHNHT